MNFQLDWIADIVLAGPWTCSAGEIRPFARILAEMNALIRFRGVDFDLQEPRLAARPSSRTNRARRIVERWTQARISWWCLLWYQRSLLVLFETVGELRIGNRRWKRLSAVLEHIRPRMLRRKTSIDRYPTP